MDPDTLLPSFIGGELSRVVSVAFFSLFVYEWLLTLDDEITYFWTGKWTTTRALFLLNRYFVMLVGVIDIISVTLETPSANLYAFSASYIPERRNQIFHSCTAVIPLLLVCNTISVFIIQAILVYRVWYIFSKNRLIQFMISAMFVVSVILAMGFTVQSATQIRLFPTGQQVGRLRVLGCRAARPYRFWRIYLPSLCLHTVLYILTAVRALQNRQLFNQAPVLKRLLRDGGFFYLVVFVTVGITSVGSFLTNFPQLNVIVAYSNYLVVINSIAVSRIMLSIHSLAAGFGSDPTFLLSNVELSRVNWRRGQTDGEIIVERWPDNINAEEEAGDPLAKVHVKTSRIGVYNGAWL